MKLRIANCYLFYAIGFFSFLFSTNSFSQSLRSTSFDDRPVCEETKGVWREFGNGCTDECRPKLDPFYVCTDAITNGCDCGKGRCWNGEVCTSLKSYKEIFAKEQAKEQKILDAAKEKRKALAIENQNKILNDLIAKSGAQSSSGAADANGSASTPNNNLAQFYKDNSAASPADPNIDKNSNSAVTVYNPAPPQQKMVTVAPPSTTPTSGNNKSEELPPILMPTIDSQPSDSKSIVPQGFLNMEKAKANSAASQQSQSNAQTTKQGQSATPTSDPMALPLIPLPN
jgi:hypothetical protein